MKRIMQKEPLVLAILVIFCALGAGETQQNLDNDELWDRLLKRKLHETKTNVRRDYAEDSSGGRESTSSSDQSGQALNGGGDDGLIDGHISGNYYNSGPIDADSVILADDQDELLTLDGSAAAEVNLASAASADTRWWESVDEQAPAESIVTEVDSNDDATIDGSGQDSLPQADASSLFDKDIVSILRSRPESREILDLLGVPKTVNETNTKDPQVLKEHLKNILTLPVGKRKYHQPLATIVETEDNIEPLATPASLYSDPRELGRPTNVLLPDLNRTLAAHRESLLPPKHGQRSLVIVFDATGSMLDDLQQLRDAARLIIAEITHKDSNPIFNYIFVPFRDPHVGPRLVTRNKDELLSALDKLQIIGGGDCPEAALEAISSAIEAAMPHSFVYVFTDATAKDFRLDQRVMQLVQKKQTPITFLLTGFCDGKATPGYQVMNNIAAASNGQVFDLRKDQIEEVLLAIRNTMDISHVPLKAIDSSKPEEHDIDLNVDSTLKEFSVSVAGVKPTIEILDPQRAPYNRTRDVLNLENIRVVNVADPAPGKWNIKATSNSSHSVRLSGHSDVQFKFGFSLLEPQDTVSLSHQPVLNKPNFLAIAPSDPALIRSLESVTIASHNVGTPGGAMFEFTLPLQLVPGTQALYRTKAFDTPRQQFKLTINGKNTNEEPLQRLLSTAIQAFAHTPPEVTVGYTHVLDLIEGDTFMLDCRIQSPFPLDASWQMNGTELIQKHFDQSNVLSMLLANVTTKDAGNYTCSAKNEIGADEQKVSVQVTPQLKPSIRLFPEYIAAFEYDPFIALRCIVDQIDGTPLLHWTHNGKPLEMATGKSQLEFEDIGPHHSGNYNCYADIAGQRVSSGNSTIVVQYAPKTPVANVALMKEYGSPVEMECKIESFPAPEYQWYYQSLDQTKELEPFDAGESMIEFTMAPDKEGLYVCEGRNVYGFVKQTFVLEGAANAAPAIIKPPETTVYVAPGSSITLNCSCELCQPLSEYIWTSLGGTFESSPEETINNIRVSLDNDQSRNAVRYLLTIDDFQTHNEASYTCIFSNQHGADAMILQLRMMVPPEVETMLLDGENVSPPGGKVVRSEGSVNSIGCEVVGLPEPTVHWQFNGKPIVTSDRYFQFENDNKTVTFRDSFSEAVQGKYECVASNPLGSRTSALELMLGAIPTATTPYNLKVKVGETITLNCSIAGTPEPAVRWEPASSFENPSLKQQNLQVSYANAGLYRCTGKNEYGTAEQIITVETFGAPEVKGASDVSLQLATGEDTLLECFGWGIPEPSIRWTFNGAPIERGSSVVVTEQGLQIYNSSYDQSGVYGCLAENEHGVRQKIHYLTVRDPPKITSALDSQVTLLPNDTVRFECSGTGSPPPNATWLFNGTAVLHDRQMYLSHSNASVGTYTCLLESTEGVDRQNMFVNVLRPPQRISGLNYTNSLEPLKVRVDDPLILVCPFDNYNSLLWQLNERNLEEYLDLADVRLRENLLIIEHLRARHEGTYTCVVQNRAGSDRQSFVVGVLSPPTIQRIHPDELSDQFGELAEETKRWMKEKPVDSAVEVNLLSGETLQLVCLATGSPKPSVYWNRGLQNERVVSQTANLTIPDVALHHSDHYTCVAENELGKSTQLYRLDVMAAPQFYDEPTQSIEVFIGDNVELDCAMQANPPASYQWLKEDYALDEFDTVLSFTNIQPQDSGMYHCDVQNIFGRNKKTFKVLVYQPAEITAYTPSQTLLAGDTVELDCEATGNPMPVLSIIHRGEVLASTAELDAPEMVIGQNYRVKTNLYKSMQMYSFSAVRVSSFDVRFSMRQPKASLLDKGKYLCMAQNAIGFNERLTKLDVMVPPYVQLSKLKSDETTIRLLEGLPLFLFCPIDGSPKPTIGWYRNTNRLKQASSTFFLPSVQQRDAGTYTCFGENPIGKTELHFELEVLVPPSIISSVLYGESNLSADQPDREEISLAAGENVTLDCSSLGHPVPAVHWMQVDYLDGSRNELLAQKDPILELYGIERTVTYSCFVNNTVGSAQKLFHLVVQAPPTWKSGPKYAFEQRVSLHHSLDLTCETDGTPEASVAWTKDGNRLEKHDADYFFGANGQTVRILAAKLTSAGSYQCVATNVLGQISREFHVTIDVPVSWSPWGAWSACSATCGSGTQFRSRICLLLNGSPAQGDQYNCHGENVELKACELLPCPVNGGWGEWSSWTNCSRQCVAEFSGQRLVRNRQRKCDSPVPSLGGKPCIGEEYEEEPCPVKYCPVDGGWTAWSSWTACSERCGFGRRQRFRSCSNPSPRHGGRPCEGAESEMNICKHQQECQVDGGWSEWKEWTRCSKTCGKGIKSRRRFCDNPAPKGGGKPCRGPNVEHEQCGTKRCRNDALIKTMEPSKNLSPLIVYDTITQQPGHTDPTNDFENSDYEANESDGERDFQVVRKYQYAEAAPVEYVDVPPPAPHPGALGITVTMTNTMPLSNDTTAFSLNFGNETVSSPTIIACMEGFVYNASSRTCADVDECLEGYCSELGQLCTNTVGSFRCDCAPGYRAIFHDTEAPDGYLVQEMHCTDINECREETHDCSHYCTNTPGSYRCYCPERAPLAKDGKTCTIKRKRNEPLRIAPLCPAGFQWKDGRCQDVDECAQQVDDCGDHYSCINTRGGYLCVVTSCPPEYEQDYERNICVLNCTVSRHLCANGVHTGQTMSFLIAEMEQFNQYQALAIVAIPAAQRSPGHNTMWTFRDRRFAHIFSLVKMHQTSGAVHLYANRQLQRGKHYKFTLTAKTFKRKRLEFIHESEVHVYWMN
uniref:Cell adhesion molecule n=1 Tax=Anopheles atroparvus TaxID=41427 RepID=A0AAG5CQZ0_ANOAO